MRYLPLVLVLAGLAVRLAQLALERGQYYGGIWPSAALWIGLAALLMTAPARRRFGLWLVGACVAVGIALAVVGGIKEEHASLFSIEPLNFADAAGQAFVAAVSFALVAPRAPRRPAVGVFVVLAALAVFAAFLPSFVSGRFYLFVERLWWLPALGALAVGANQARFAT